MDNYRYFIREDVNIAIHGYYIFKIGYLSHAYRMSFDPNEDYKMMIEEKDVIEFIKDGKHTEISGQLADGLLLEWYRKTTPFNRLPEWFTIKLFKGTLD